MQTNPVFRSLNRPLTILGAERKLFFFALVMGACVFNLLNSLAGAVGMFSRCISSRDGRRGPIRKSFGSC